VRADEDEIRALVSTWMAATRRGDVPAVLDLMTDDVVFLVPGRAPMRKPEFAAAARAQAGGAAPKFDGTSEIQEVDVHGDRAYAWSRLRVVATPPGGYPLERTGHTLTVFRREGGRWRLARDANLLAAGPRIAEVAYIRASLAAVWEALTDPDLTARYWGGTRIESDWKPGSEILYRRGGEVTDRNAVLAVDAPHRLVHTFQPVAEEFAGEAPSRVEFRLAESAGVVRLSVAHEGFPPGSRVHAACAQAWPMILASLKTLLETGTPLPVASFP